MCLRACGPYSKYLTSLSSTGPDIVRISFELRKELPDYIDCIIVATAISLGEDLLTEDRLIHRLKNNVEQKYKIKI